MYVAVSSDLRSPYTRIRWLKLQNLDVRYLSCESSACAEVCFSIDVERVGLIIREARTCIPQGLRVFRVL